jgi:hypothetical protein
VIRTLALEPHDFLERNQGTCFEGTYYDLDIKRCRCHHCGDGPPHDYSSFYGDPRSADECFDLRSPGEPSYFNYYDDSCSCPHCILRNILGVTVKVEHGPAPLEDADGVIMIDCT